MDGGSLTNSTMPLVISSITYACLFTEDNHQKKKTIIAIIYVLTSSLSILGSSSVLIYAIFKKTVRSPEVCPLFHLALADFMLAFLWLAGALSWFHWEHSNCFYLDAVGEIAHIASFFLTTNYALNAFLRLCEKTHNINNLEFSSVHVTTRSYLWISRIGYAVCWLIPVGIMLPLLIYSIRRHTFDKLQNSCTFCLLLFDRPKVKSADPLWWSPYGSIALTCSLSISMVTLVLVYVMILRVFRKAVVYSGVLTDLQRANIDAIRNRIFLYILVFLVCWGPALVVASCDIDPHIIKLSAMRHWFILFVFQGLTAPMQGFLNCIVYGWTRKSFRDATETRSPLLESDDYSFFRPRRSSYGASSFRSL